MLRRHLNLLIEHYATAGEQERSRHAELRACRDIRKHIAWYNRGYRVGHEVRLDLTHVSSVTEFERIVTSLDGDQPYPGEVAQGPRGRIRSPRRVALPEGWLDGREFAAAEAVDVGQAELPVSGD